MGVKLPISPLVGEMSGRTEGGNVEHERSQSSKLAQNYTVERGQRKTVRFLPPP